MYRLIHNKSRNQVFAILLNCSLAAEDKTMTPARRQMQLKNEGKNN